MLNEVYFPDPDELNSDRWVKPNVDEVGELPLNNGGESHPHQQSHGLAPRTLELRTHHRIDHRLKEDLAWCIAGLDHHKSASISAADIGTTSSINFTIPDPRNHRSFKYQPQSCNLISISRTLPHIIKRPQITRRLVRTSGLSSCLSCHYRWLCRTKRSHFSQDAQNLNLLGRPWLIAF